MRSGRKQAFTLIELLVVIAIISILAGLIFAAFAGVRAKARTVSCESNLRQIGMSMEQYMQDYDGFYPWGDDPSDKYTNIWAPYPKYAAEIRTMPLLNDLLTPYVRNTDVWRCPSDTGFDTLDEGISGYTGVPLNARPTMFDAFGTSYLYRTQLTLLGESDSTLSGTIQGSTYSVGPASINILMDGNGSWHGSGWPAGRRYNVLMGDGHVANQGTNAFFVTSSWGVTISPL